MKNVLIQKLTVEEFERELSQENFDYIQETYPSIERALEVYKEGSELSGKDEYLGINEYFEVDKEQYEEFKSLD